MALNTLNNSTRTHRTRFKRANQLPPRRQWPPIFRPPTTQQIHFRMAGSIASGGIHAPPDKLPISVEQPCLNRAVLKCNLVLQTPHRESRTFTHDIGGNEKRCFVPARYPRLDACWDRRQTREAFCAHYHHASAQLGWLIIQKNTRTQHKVSGTRKHPPDARDQIRKCGVGLIH